MLVSQQFVRVLLATSFWWCEVPSASSLALLPAMTLRWPPHPSRDEALPAHALPQEGCSVFARPAPSPGSTPRLPCPAQRFSRARVCGEDGDGVAHRGRHAVSAPTYFCADITH